MRNHDERKICFVIAPIGGEGTEIRTRSDQVLKHVITPPAEQCGYEVIRADKISEPGIITSQIIQNVVEAPLVLADLSGRNPNVYYELAVRHALRKPVVQIIQSGETIPFDVAGTRTIDFDLHDLDSVARCKDKILEQIRSVEKDPTHVDTPISAAIDLQALRRSDNLLEKSNAEIMSMIHELRTMVGGLTVRGSKLRIEDRTFGDVVAHLRHLDELLDAPADVRTTEDWGRQARFYLTRVFGLLLAIVESGAFSYETLREVFLRRSATSYPTMGEVFLRPSPATRPRRKIRRKTSKGQKER